MVICNAIISLSDTWALCSCDFTILFHYLYRSGGPSYGGAQEWITKHQDYLNQSLRYIQRYPNIVEVTIAYINYKIF